MEELKTLYIKKINRVNVVSQARPIVLNKTEKDRTVCSFVYKTTGKTYYHFNGKKYLSDANHVVFLTKEKPYTMECIEPCTCIMIYVELVNDIDTFLSLPITDVKSVSQTFFAISRKWALKKEHYEMKILAMFYTMFTNILELQEIGYSSRNKLRLIKTAVEYIENNFTNPELNNQMLAEKCNMSEVYFRKLFTQIYSIPPMQDVHRLRMERARDMLLGDYESISAVAEEVGFGNIYSFSRAFKQATGLSPSEYVKHAK